MKKLLLLFAIVPLWCLPSVAGATLISSSTFYFEGFAAGGTGSATMTIDIEDQTLTATIDNTSPTLLDDGTGANYPGITGFGFNLDPADLSLDSWTLTAINTEAEETTIGSSGVSDEDEWEMATRLTNIKLDYIPTNGGEGDGRLYNPDAGVLDYGSNDVYYTTAVLTMTFNDEPSLNTDDQFSPFVRMQNVGKDGEGSLKLTGTPGEPPSAVPEPATLLLMVPGLLALAGMGRRKFKK